MVSSILPHRYSAQPYRALHLKFAGDEEAAQPPGGSNGLFFDSRMAPLKPVGETVGPAQPPPPPVPKSGRSPRRLSPWGIVLSVGLLLVSAVGVQISRTEITTRDAQIEELQRTLDAKTESERLAREALDGKQDRLDFFSQAFTLAQPYQLALSRINYYSSVANFFETPGKDKALLAEIELTFKNDFSQFGETTYDCSSASNENFRRLVEKIPRAEMSDYAKASLYVIIAYNLSLACLAHGVSNNTEDKLKTLLDIVTDPTDPEVGLRLDLQFTILEALEGFLPVNEFSPTATPEKTIHQRVVNRKDEVRVQMVGAGISLPPVAQTWQDSEVPLVLFEPGGYLSVVSRDYYVRFAKTAVPEKDAIKRLDYYGNNGEQKISVSEGVNQVLIDINQLPSRSICTTDEAVSIQAFKDELDTLLEKAVSSSFDDYDKSLILVVLSNQLYNNCGVSSTTASDNWLKVIKAARNNIQNPGLRYTLLRFLRDAFYSDDYSQPLRTALTDFEDEITSDMEKAGIPPVRIVAGYDPPPTTTTTLTTTTETQ